MLHDPDGTVHYYAPAHHCARTPRDECPDTGTRCDGCIGHATRLDLSQATILTWPPAETTTATRSE